MINKEKRIRKKEPGMFRQTETEKAKQTRKTDVKTNHILVPVTPDKQDGLALKK